MNRPSTRVALTRATYCRRNVFPGQIGAEGYYDLVSQVPVLSSVEAADFDAFRTDPSSPAGRHVGALLAHEVTHWADHVGTVWGQRRLAALYQAMEASENQDEPEMWRIAYEASTASRDRLTDYYTVVARDVAPDEDRPWRTQLTCGYEYGADGHIRPDRPILFYRFHGYQNGPICRVPFSVASLLEANATYAELLSLLEAVGTVEDDVARIIELRLERDRLQRRLYAPRLGVYALVAHHAANTLGLSDSARGYHVASMLATLALNLPDAAFGELPIPNTLRPFGDRVDHLISMRDRGLAFYLLSVNAPPYPLETVDPTDTDVLEGWAGEVVARSGLGTLAALGETARNEIGSVQKIQLTGGREPLYRRLADSGLEVFDGRGLAGTRPTSIGSLATQADYPTPPVLLGDDSVVAIGRRFLSVDEYAFEERLDAGWEYTVRAVEFVAACRS